MDLTSMDIADEKREELKRCLGNAFPDVFSEGGVYSTSSISFSAKLPTASMTLVRMLEPLGPLRIA